MKGVRTAVHAFRRRATVSSCVLIAATCLVLGLGAPDATAASKEHSGSWTIGSCTIVVHPSATHYTQCVGMHLVGAQLGGADLSHAVLTRADLSNADLVGATLTDANLGGAVLTGATLSSVKWDGTTCPDGTNSNDAGGDCSAHLTLNLPSSSIGPSSSLPKTGFDPWPFLAWAGALIAAGALLVTWARFPRRRRTGLLTR